MTISNSKFVKPLWLNESLLMFRDDFMQKPELISVEWNFGLWAMFTAYDKLQAKESFDKGYRYCERRKYSPDVCYLKNKPRKFARNTRVYSLSATGELGDFK